MLSSFTNINAIIEEVCKLYQIEKKVLTAPGKGPLASEARTVISWIVRELPDLYLMNLARIFKRDISTLSNSIGKILIRSDNDSELKNKLEKLAKIFQIEGTKA